MDNFDFVNLSSTFGLIATGFFIANLLLGILLSTKYQRTLTWQKLPRFVRSISLYQVHNYTAYIALLTAFTHPVLLFQHASKSYAISLQEFIMLSFLGLKRKNRANFICVPILKPMHFQCIVV